MDIKYILVFDNEGYATETKFLSSLDELNMPKERTKIKNFYEEELSFFNLSGVIHDDIGYIIKSGNLKGYEKESIKKEIKDLLKSFLLVLKKSNSKKLFEKEEDKNSLFEELLNNFEKYWKINIKEHSEINQEKFNIQEYKDIQNYLIAFSHISNEPYLTSYIKNIIHISNNALIHDNIIIAGNGKSFNHIKRTEDKHGNEIEYIDYNFEKKIDSLKYNYSSFLVNYLKKDNKIGKPKFN